jgi:NitT/TauT family transport system substrate-binding protein
MAKVAGRSKRHLCVLQLAVLWFLVACTGGPATIDAHLGSRPVTRSPVRIAAAPTVIGAPLAVAIARGYFRDEALEVDLQSSAAAQDSVLLAATGKLDLAVVGLNTGLYNGVARGLDVKVVSSMAVNPMHGYPTALVVRRDLLMSGQVTTLSDLKGRRIAVRGGAGSPAGYVLATKLREAGLHLKDIEVVNLGLPEQVAAMQARTIDVAIPPAPFTTQMLLDGTVELFGGPVTPGRSETATIMRGAFLRERPDAARETLMALMRGAHDLQGAEYKSPGNLDLLSKFTGLPIETVQAMDPYEFRPDLALRAEEILAAQQVFLEEGLLEYGNPLPVQQLSDEATWRAAAERLNAERP